jgi:hypothetical protein
METNGFHGWEAEGFLVDNYANGFTMSRHNPKDTQSELPTTAKACNAVHSCGEVYSEVHVTLVLNLASEPTGCYMNLAVLRSKYM